MTSAGRGRGRLSRSAEFERVYRHGRSTANRHLVLYVFANPARRDAAARPVGVAQGGRRGRAQPGQAAAARGVRARGGRDAPRGQDVVVVARPAAAELAEREGLAGVEAALAELIAKAGLRGGARCDESGAVAQQDPAA